MGILQNIGRTYSPLIKAVNRQIGIRGAEPRKGNFQWMAGLPSKKVLKPIVINALTLKQLANTDPITWAIKSTRKAQVTQMEWDIVRDTELIELEFDRWLNILLANMNPWGFEERYHPVLINQELYLKCSNDIKNILATVVVSKQDRKKQLKWYFESMKRKVRQDADEHALIVKKIFEKPNGSDCKNFRTFCDLLVDDLLTFDAGVIVKNRNYMGELAELYLLPGHEVKLYRNPDRTIPNPPEAAYVWEENGTLRAEFDKNEIVYLMANPQQNGYGMSPLEVAAYVITASLYAEEYNMDFFKHSNVPPGVFDLGKNITQEQKKSFETLWDNEVQGRGLHRMMFLAGSEGAKYVPIRSATSREMQMMEYLKWTLSIKCACYQISPQDISFVQDFHRSTAQVQKELTKERGIKNILNLLAGCFNSEIIKAEFPFKDVKFQWQGMDMEDEISQSTIDINDINNGIISRNDRRKRLGLPPVDGGDVILVNVQPGAMPIEDLVPPEEDEAATQPIEEAMAEKEATGQPTGLAQARDQAAVETKQQVAMPGVAKKPVAVSPSEPKTEPIPKTIKVITASIDEQKLAKVMDSLKEQGLDDKEVHIKLEE